ncbi:TlpA family protein disulfide reductase [Flavobacterium sp.]|jgi:thiol-disulfide isomerase/thioredoxin|uniref:TlpA family protein disulfide reductase n=1 Tax=Flavobacterium sp. TaxID=239 RepID=UPI0037C0C3EA
MKKIIASICLVLGIISCTNAQKKEFSEDALNESMQTLDGSKITFQEILKKYEGKTIVIDIWASWCPDCIKGMPKVQALQEKYTDVVYLFLSYDKTPEAWEKGITKYNIRGEHYLIVSNWKGGGFVKTVDIDWIPRYIVVDKTGKIALYRAIEADEEQLITTLNNLTK